MSPTRPTKNKPRPDSSKDVVVSGQPVRNKLLFALPKNERDILFPSLEFLPLPVDTNLSEKGVKIKFGYFLNDGLASVLSVMKSEKEHRSRAVW
jgi:hypothetical protein